MSDFREVQVLGSRIVQRVSATQSAPLVREREGGFVCTNSGIAYYPLDPRPGDIHVPDIAYALSKLCRYGGHCLDFYSVAEHSVLASYLVPPRFALHALLHDAAEAYLVDLPRPIKRSLALYKAIERRNERIIWPHFGLPIDMPAEVHAADQTMLMTEKPVLMPPTEWDPRDITDDAADIPIFCWDHHEAALQFMARYHQLT